MTNFSYPHPSLKPYPDPQNVFSEPIERYARHLHPLISIELSLVDEALEGWIHMVSPIEPSDGLLGDGGEEYWGGYLQPNWLGFKLNSDHKYELLGDFRFFGIENIDGKEAYKGAREELYEFYEEQQESYNKHKQFFNEKGQVSRLVRDRVHPVETVAKVGGKAPIGNMIMPLENSPFTYLDEDAAPRMINGRLFKFIASAPGYNYRDFGADQILLYYDPIERIALQTFVWG